MSAAHSFILSRYHVPVHNLESVVPPNAVITNYFQAACSHVMLRDSMTDERSVCGRLACRIMRSHTALSDASKITNQAGAGVDWWRQAGIEERKRKEELRRGAELRDAMYGGDRIAGRGRRKADNNRHVGKQSEHDRKFGDGEKSSYRNTKRSYDGRVELRNVRADVDAQLTQKIKQLLKNPSLTYQNIGDQITLSERAIRMRASLIYQELGIEGRFEYVMLFHAPLDLTSQIIARGAQA